MSEREDADASPEELHLEWGDGELGLNCRSGGSVLYYRREGRNLLRPAPDGRHDPVAMAAFPLVPFPGRITNGLFRFRDADIRLPPNFPPEPHAIHGHGWQDSWTVAARTEASATIEFTYRGTDWPWRYRAEQRFELGEDALRLTMSLTNLGPGSMPAGLGWHPYFRREGAILQADTLGIWHSDGLMVAGRPVSPVAE